MRSIPKEITKELLEKLYVEEKNLYEEKKSLINLIFFALYRARLESEK